MTKDPDSDSKPPYPSEILPVKDNYVIQIDHNYLVDQVADLCLQRCVEHPLNDEITPEDLGDNLNGLSVNLLGGKFELSHVKWRATDLNEYWDGSAVSVDDLKSNYKYDHKFCGVYINAARVDGLVFKHPRHYIDEDKFNEDISAFVDKFASYRKGEPVEMYFVINVVHRPTFANYWHSQIEVSKNTKPVSDPFLNVKAKWEKKMFRSFRTFLLPYCNKIVPCQIPPVDESKYLKRQNQ